MNVKIRNYQVPDFEEVIDLWNKCMTRDYISPEKFQLKVLADRNFDPEGCKVAETNGEIVGFILGVLRKVPFEGVGLQEDTGWITVFFVKPDLRRKGIANKLLESVLDYFRDNGREKVYVSSYVPNYFIPGVDVDSYQEAFKFLLNNGFEDEERVIGMGAELQDLVIPERVIKKIDDLAKRNILIKRYEPKYAYSLLDFLRREFPGDWPRVIENKIISGTIDEIVLAVKDEEVLGYCQFEGSHFGPFGVSEKLRGEGIGSILFWKVVDLMKQEDYHFVWLAWTEGDAARFYREKGGLHKTREHSIMVKYL